MKVKITAEYLPTDDEIDADDSTGLTEKAYMELFDALQMQGLTEIEVVKEP